MRLHERKGKKGSTWYIIYNYKGRCKWEAIGPDRKLAQAVAKKRELEILEGKFLPEAKNSKVKFKDFAKEYIEKHSRRRKRSWPKDARNLRIHLLPVFGDFCLSDITPRMIEDYRLRREKEGAELGTINREHALLKHMFTKAMDWEIVQGNPAKRIRLAKEKPRSRYLTREEIHCLIEATESSKAPHLRPIVIMALNTGMRIGEILNLKWDDVDFNRRVIQVQQTKNDQPREVPMTDWLFETLWDWRKKSLDFPYVFSNISGKPITTVRTSFAVALKKAGIKDFRFHDLRHTAASQMYMSGLDIKSIKEICGWKTLSMVDRYSHLTTEHKRRVMLEFEIYIQPKKSSKNVAKNLAHL
jgi:integrase